MVLGLDWVSKETAEADQERLALVRAQAAVRRVQQQAAAMRQRTEQRLAGDALALVRQAQQHAAAAQRQVERHLERRAKAAVAQVRQNARQAAQQTVQQKLDQMF